MGGREVKLVDTTLRDGQASIWASRMRVGAMVPAVPDIDAAGYDSMEFVTPNSQFVRWARDLGENPWHWVENVVRLARNTPLRLMGGEASWVRTVPACVTELILERFSELGVNLTRTGDPWHNVDRIAARMDHLSRYQFRSIIHVIYTISPFHTLDYYTEKVRAIAALRPFRICLKDVGGLLTPDVARPLMEMMVRESDGIDLEFHAHCNGSLALACASIAAEVGFTHIHTGIPPLASGRAQPSVFDVKRNLTALGYTVNVDTEPLERVSRHLYGVAAREKLPVGEAIEYDESHYQNQLPGGMLSHFAFQLSQLKLGHLLPEIMAEAIQVRAELGYPIVITPYASWIGSQAAINVATGKRYETVTDELIKYAYGFEPHSEGAEMMDQSVREKILSTPRAAELANWSRWQPDLEEMRQLYGTNSDDELILCCFIGESAKEVLAKQREYPHDYASYALRSGSIVDVMTQLRAASRTKHVRISRNGATATLATANPVEAAS